MYGKKTCGSPQCVRAWRTGDPQLNFMRMQYAEMTTTERFEYDQNQVDDTPPQRLLSEIAEEDKEIEQNLHKQRTQDMPSTLRDMVSPTNAPIKKED